MVGFLVGGALMVGIAEGNREAVADRHCLQTGHAFGKIEAGVIVCYDTVRVK
jgi:hypothetical protein